jgi:ketosteroid isomerase-like protein
MTEAERLARRFYQAVDARDYVHASNLLSDDVDFRFGSGVPTTGRQGFDTFVAVGLGPNIKSISHRLLYTWTVESCPSTFICEMEVTYTRSDDSTLTLPCMSKLQVREGRISVLRVYMDINPALESHSS